MFPNIGMNLYQWLENTEKRFTRNGENITIVEKRKNEKGLDELRDDRRILSLFIIYRGWSQIMDQTGNCL